MSEKMYKIAVLGGGSFGTVIANIMAEKGHDVRQWMRSAKAAAEITSRRENSRYLPGYILAPTLTAHTDLAAALEDIELLFVSIPSAHFREVLKLAAPYLPEKIKVISTTKGIENHSFKMMSQIAAEELPLASVGAISGPNFAKELAQRQLTATVIASTDPQLRESVQKLLHQAYFRVYASDDIYGVELGGVLKNIYAIASGLSAAMGMGENTRSMLLTRALAEMSRFAVSMGANPMTFLGLAGVGDLVATCMSPLSRNYRVGFALGSGQSLDEAVAELGQVAEGVNTLRIVRDKCQQLDVYMPLLQGLYQVVYQGAAPSEVAKSMMLSEQSSDVEFVLPR
ncbi:MAG: NAD(P)H-dependent glycerol-3-phosphate dehydrogenase [Oceanospirillaceae bacterium]|nr:NAD(P)H-dependent glycerol-3-phosphate dehydrogenase [Oceanospirillaceae bacterium]